MKEIRNVHIAGAGVMGSAIAQVFALAGYTVSVYDISQAALEKVGETVQNNLNYLIERQKLAPDAAEQALARISTTADMADFSTADLVIEAIIEKMDIKQSFFQRLEAIVAPDALLATNTSGLSINGIGALLRDKSRFLGANWWTPAYIIPLVEIVRCDETADATVQALYDILTAVGKKPIVINREVSGFVGNRMQFALFREAMHIVEEGLATPEDVDKVLKYGLGLRYAVLGPFSVADYGGVDTYFHISDSLFADLDTRQDANTLIRKLYEAGHYGLKTGEGFYTYPAEDRQRLLDARDDKLLAILALDC